jgi:hypothetical protein
MADNEPETSISLVKRSILNSMTFYLRFRYSEDRWSLKHPFRGMEILIGVVFNEGSVSNFGPKRLSHSFENPPDLPVRSQILGYYFCIYGQLFAMTKRDRVRIYISRSVRWKILF